MAIIQSNFVEKLKESDGEKLTECKNTYKKYRNEKKLYKKQLVQKIQPSPCPSP